MSRKGLFAGIGIALASGGIALAPPAQAAFPGENGEIAFARTLATPAGPETFEVRRELRVIDPATGEQRVIDTGTATVDPDGTTAGPRSGQILAAPEFSPDGKTLAADSYAPTQPDNGLLFGDAVGLLLPFGKDTRLYDAQTGAHSCTHVGAVSSSPLQWDGARNQIVLSRAPSADLVNFFDGAPERVDASCGGAPAAPSPVQLNSQFAISPDGSRVVTGDDFAPDGNGPPNSFVVQNIDGTGPQTFDLGGSGFYPDWTPDGSEIVFGFQNEDTDEGGIKALDPASGQMRTIVNEPSPEPDESYIMLPSVSPDGTKVVYSRFNFGSPENSSLFIVDSDRDATDLSAAAPDQLTNPSGAALSVDLQPNWGPKPQPDAPTPPPPAGPAPTPGAPTAGNAVCNEVPERPTSKKGTIRYTKTGLKIQQNIDSALLRRVNAVNRWIDEGIVPTDLCAGAFGPGAFQANMAFVGGAPHDASPPTPRDTNIVKRNKSGGEITRSKTQLEINENIGRALRARVKATLERINSLTGGNLAPGANLAGREVYPGLTTSGPKPPSADAAARELEIGPLPRRIKIVAGASTMRLQQKRSQVSVILVNRALDTVAGGLTEEHFEPGSLGSSRI